MQTQGDEMNMPEGWPTDVMIEVGANIISAAGRCDTWEKASETAKRIYNSMSSHAPTPPENVKYGCCGNGECNWRGKLAECSYLGSIGPCCPKCREIVEPDQAPTPPAQEDSVKIPTSPEEAELMAKLGMVWLQQNAPDRLNVPAPEAESVAWKDAVKRVYGYLWHINEEPGTPAPMYSPAKAAHEARKILRDLLIHEERGQGISMARSELRARAELDKGKS